MTACKDQFRFTIPKLQEQPTNLNVSRLLDFFNGTFIETFDALVTSDGATITMSLEKSGGGDLTMVFSNGQSAFDCTPAATISLTAGIDTFPQMNWIYILRSTKLLTKSTSGWPSDVEHIKVGVFYVQSASLVQSGAAGANWAIINQNWNDHAADDSGQGHETDITELLRHGGPGWRSGCEGVATQDGNDLWVSIATGVISQMHEHVFDALDSDTAGAGDPIVVINDPDAEFAMINSLNSVTKLSNGDAISNNKWVKFVFFVVANKTGEVSPMVMNLPDGFYNTQAQAERDVDGHANFNIPDEFTIESSTGHLIVAFVCQHTATAMEIGSTENLRGKIPFNVSSSGTGGGDVTAAAVIVDNALVRGDGGAKGIQDSGVLLDDSNNMLFPGTAQLQFNTTAERIESPSAGKCAVRAQTELLFNIDGTDRVIVGDDVMFSPTGANLGKVSPRFGVGYMEVLNALRATDPSAEVGNFWYNEAEKAHKVENDAGIFNATASVSLTTIDRVVFNSTAEESFADTFDIKANSLVVGTTYEFWFGGDLDTDATIDYQWFLLGDAVKLMSTGVVSQTAVTDESWFVHGFFTCRSIGATGTIQCNAIFGCPRVGASTITSTTLSTHDTTQIITIAAAVQMSVAGFSKACSMKQFIFKKVA